jgi:hypothetical protein
MHIPQRRATQCRLVFAALLFLIRLTVCWAQDVSVRLIDVRSGHPILGRPVTIQYKKSVGPTFETETVITDSHGEAIVQLPNPAPKDISIVAYGLYPCYNFQPIETRLLIESGAAPHCVKPSQACHCKFNKQVNDIKAKPGQMILLARPFTGWEKFLQRIWE